MLLVGRGSTDYEWRANCNSRAFDGVIARCPAYRLRLLYCGLRNSITATVPLCLPMQDW